MCFLARVDTHQLKGQVVVVEAADEKLKAELEKEVDSKAFIYLIPSERLLAMEELSSRM